MKLFQYFEVRNTQTGEAYCEMPYIAWMLTEPRKPLHFLSGTIVMSYACDPERKVGLLLHLYDAFITWAKCYIYEKITQQSQKWVLK